MESTEKLIKKIFLLIFLVASTNIYAQEIASSEKRQIHSGEYYSMHDELPCDEHDVVITSSCLRIEDNYSYCYSQVVAFIDPKTKSRKIIHYEYTSDSQPFIYGAACTKEKNVQYVILLSSNLGNCHICEWRDMFKADGTYLISTPGMPDKTSFKTQIYSKRTQENIFLMRDVLEEIHLKSFSK